MTFISSQTDQVPIQQIVALATWLIWHESRPRPAITKSRAGRPTKHAASSSKSIHIRNSIHSPRMRSSSSMSHNFPLSLSWSAAKRVMSLWSPLAHLAQSMTVAFRARLKSSSKVVALTLLHINIKTIGKVHPRQLSSFNRSLISGESWQR